MNSKALITITIAAAAAAGAAILAMKLLGMDPDAQIAGGVGGGVAGAVAGFMISRKDQSAQA